MKNDISALRGVIKNAPEGKWRHAHIYRALVPYLSGNLKQASKELEPLKTNTSYQPFLVKHLIALIEGDTAAGVRHFYNAIEAGEPESMVPFGNSYVSLAWRNAFPEFYSKRAYEEVLAEFGLDEKSLEKIQVPPILFNKG